ILTAITVGALLGGLLTAAAAAAADEPPVAGQGIESLPPPPWTGLNDPLTLEPPDAPKLTPVRSSSFSSPSPPPVQGPSTMPYRPGDPIPRGYHVGQVGNANLFIAGVVALPNLYVLAAVSAIRDEHALPALIPVVGPFIVGATHPPNTT